LPYFHVAAETLIAVAEARDFVLTQRYIAKGSALPIFA
jgi:hypothetical protein